MFVSAAVPEILFGPWKPWIDCGRDGTGLKRTPGTDPGQTVTDPWTDPGQNADRTRTDLGQSINRPRTDR